MTLIGDVRDWIAAVEEIGELERVDGAHWDAEMGPLVQLIQERRADRAPAVLFDHVPGYPAGYRCLYGHFGTVRRLALSLGLPLDLPRKADYVPAYHRLLAGLRPVPPVEVESGPVLSHVLTGGDVDVLRFPVPRHHEQDTHRFIATASVVITRDPDEGWVNLGAYRSMVYEPAVIGCQITEGKHGRIIRDKYFERGQPMPVAICCGQDPLLYLLASSPFPAGQSEYDWAGAIRGEPVPVVRGPYTGLPVPATAEIVVEGDLVPDDRRDEGPFGEWMGYYCGQPVPRPVVHVKSILHRDEPILCCAPQHKPIDETALIRSIPGGATLMEQLRSAGIPDVRGVWLHEAGCAWRFAVISIRQRYPGHARQTLHVASGCSAIAYNGKWAIVVDEDIDPSDIHQVTWALSTRFDPVEDIDVMRKAWSSGRDPLVLPGTGNFHNRILIDACIPYDRKLNGTFPPVVEVSAEKRQALEARWSALLGGGVR